MRAGERRGKKKWWEEKEDKTKRVEKGDRARGMDEKKTEEEGKEVEEKEEEKDEEKRKKLFPKMRFVLVIHSCPHSLLPRFRNPGLQLFQTPLHLPPHHGG